MDNAEMIINNIDAAISRADESRKSLSDKTGIPYTTLSRRLQDGLSFTLSEIAKIADALDVTPKSLVEPFVTEQEPAA